jgi:hypothetical protein
MVCISHVSYDMRHVSYHMGHVSYDMSHVSYDMSQFVCMNGVHNLHLMYQFLICESCLYDMSHVSYDIMYIHT